MRTTAVNRRQSLLSERSSWTVQWPFGRGYLPRGICVKQRSCRRQPPRPGPGPLDSSAVSDSPTTSDFYLRARAVERPFHVVLVEPEIPPNTGNVARLCAATRCPLHLVGRLGFRIDEHAVRRAGLDYWHLVDVKTHETLL